MHVDLSRLKSSGKLLRMSILIIKTLQRYPYITIEQVQACITLTQRLMQNQNVIEVQVFAFNNRVLPKDFSRIIYPNIDSQTTVSLSYASE